MASGGRRGLVCVPRANRTSFEDPATDEPAPSLSTFLLERWEPRGGREGWWTDDARSLLVAVCWCVGGGKLVGSGGSVLSEGGQYGQSTPAGTQGKEKARHERGWACSSPSCGRRRGSRLWLRNRTVAELLIR
ncbi:unnamed protein product [Hapterophycus canaliculatus]